MTKRAAQAGAEDVFFKMSHWVRKMTTYWTTAHQMVFIQGQNLVFSAKLIMAPVTFILINKPDQAGFPSVSRCGCWKKKKCPTRQPRPAACTSTALLAEHHTAHCAGKAVRLREDLNPHTHKVDGCFTNSSPVKAWQVQEKCGLFTFLLIDFSHNISWKQARTAVY